MNDGKESGVVADFAAWLEGQGWQVHLEQDWADVVAARDGARIVGEAKGVTTSPGLDVDTAYGQLLRRMDPRDTTTIYALVVPPKALKAALRVSGGTRERLRIDVYSVTESGEVIKH